MTTIKKPKLQKQEYYDWSDIREYLLANKLISREILDEMWDYFCNMRDNMGNGMPFDVYEDDPWSPENYSDEFVTAFDILRKEFGEEFTAIFSW